MLPVRIRASRSQSALQQARRVAGGKDVLIGGGARVVQQYVAADDASWRSAAVWGIEPDYHTSPRRAPHGKPGPDAGRALAHAHEPEVSGVRYPAFVGD